jgi:hypothetical protein
MKRMVTLFLTKRRQKKVMMEKNKYEGEVRHGTQ